MQHYSAAEKNLILNTAANVIKFGLETQQILPLKLTDYPKKLSTDGASFVTLEINQQLRGCIGTLEAYQPLIQDIAQNTYSAAFRDPRFPPLTIEEHPHLTKQISILSPTIPIVFASEQDLLQQLRPGIDGLVLAEQGKRGTFLPAVWKALPTPKLFLNQLKLKAGLPADYWSTTIQVAKYTVEVIA